jgi:SAM-dependent methyltransferase
MNIDFSGEYFVPGQSSPRLEADHLARYRFASRFVRGKSVLDIACGVGYGSDLLSKAGASRVDGVDINEDVIAYARENYASESTRFLPGDIYTFSSPARYDVIVSFETIEHVDDYGKALANIFRLLSDSGRLIISSPNRSITSPKARTMDDKPRNIHHVREFTIDELKSALTAHGFAVKQGNIFGQRQQPYFDSGTLNRLYTLLFKPKRRTDPSVTPVRHRAPRYIVIVAEKAGARDGPG